MEISEFYDWQAAAQALHIDEKLQWMNIEVYPHVSAQQRNQTWTNMSNERSMLLGDNPFQATEQEIQETRKKLRLKKAGK